MDSVSILRFFTAFALVLALMWLLSLLMKRLGYGQAMMVKKADRRLKLVEYLSLDAKNRLVLVARDGVQHLLLVGAEHATIVESDIKDIPKPKEQTDEKT